MALQHATPVTIDRLDDIAVISRLVRLRRSAKPGEGPRIDERLLQKLIHHSPSILPIGEIEPLFANLRPVCEELPLRGGNSGKYIDNLLVNSDGKVCLVECKLWRNSEAVREVIAQVLDYAGELALLSYDELVAAVRVALKQSDGDPLADCVLGVECSEDARTDFIDAVSRSLRLGNFLLLVVGDGIRPDVQQISQLLQNRATLGFSLGLIETAIYGAVGGGGPFYIQPRVLVQTEVVTRTVFVGGTDATGPKITKVEATGKPATLSEQEFFNNLAQVNPTHPDRLRSFLDGCRNTGCEPSLRRRYSLYIDDPTDRRLNLGTLSKEGTVEFWGIGAHDQEYGEPVGRRYMEKIIQFLPDAHIASTPNGDSEYIRYHGKIAIPLGEMMDRSEEWLGAIQQVMDRFAEIERLRP